MKFSEYEDLLEKDPGNPAFAEFARVLAGREDYGRALQVCFKGLTANPAVHQGRLILAKIFYLSGYGTFAVRELKQLAGEFPENRTIRRLLEKFGHFDGAGAEKLEKTPENSVGLSNDESSANINEDEPEGTVAEVEFDFDILESIDEE